MIKRNVSVVFAALGVAFGAGAHASDSFPAKPITLIVPFSAGGPADIIARALAPQVEAALGQPLIIDNRAGGNANIGHSAAARSTPDGYTLVYVAPGIVTNPALYKTKMVNPLTELTPVAQLTSQSYILLANPKFGPKTVAELLEAAKKSPVTCASGGGLPALGCDWLQSVSDSNVTHVRYKGIQALTDLMGGHVDTMFDLFNTALPQVETGNVRPIALTRAERGTPLPDVPVFSETIPSFVLVGWHGIMAPAGTPAPIVEKLNQAFTKAVRHPEVSKRITDSYIEVTPKSADEFGKVIKDDMEKYARIVREAGIEPQ